MHLCEQGGHTLATDSIANASRCDCAYNKQTIEIGRWVVVVSITGRPWHLVGIDKSHALSRHCKKAVAHPNKGLPH